MSQLQRYTYIERLQKGNGFEMGMIGVIDLWLIHITGNLDYSDVLDIYCYQKLQSWEFSREGTDPLISIYLSSL